MKWFEKGQITMDFAALLPSVAVLACPIGMGLMMWMMHKNMGGSTGQAAPSEQPPTARLAALREQRQMLEAEISEVSRIVELENERARVLAAQPTIADAARSATVQG